VCRRGRLSLVGLRVIDAGLPIAICGDTAAQTVLWPGRVPGQEWGAVLALTNILSARAVFIPSPPRRTLAVGLFAAVPVAGAAVVAPWAGGSSRPESPLLVALGTLVWCLCAVAITTLASAVIFGLRQKVQEVQQLGQYTLEEKLGEGGMGVVYRARHAMLRRPTAVKLLPREKAGEDSIRRFEREVQMTAQLSHPNTVAIYDYGRTPEGVFYYAMEYLQGIDLQTLVRDHGALPPARVVHLLRQVAGALGEAHGVGLVHRDVKPANVILSERGGHPDVAKVVDFGLVKELAVGRNASLTDVKTLAGTPRYMSPEAITDPEKVDGRSDLYALGAVGYFLLTGQDVFTGATLIEICSHHLHTPPVPPSERIGRPLPAKLEALVLDCLRKYAAQRPQTAREVLARLDACDDVGTWTDEDARRWWEEHHEREAAPLPELQVLPTIDLRDTRPSARSDR
jgi:eukaryotic-like serine/threonine-protein kinase